MLPVHNQMSYYYSEIVLAEWELQLKCISVLKTVFHSICVEQLINGSKCYLAFFYGMYNVQIGSDANRLPSSISVLTLVSVEQNDRISIKQPFSRPLTWFFMLYKRAYCGHFSSRYNRLNFIRLFRSQNHSQSITLDISALRSVVICYVLVNFKIRSFECARTHFTVFVSCRERARTVAYSLFAEICRCVQCFRWIFSVFFCCLSPFANLL